MENVFLIGGSGFIGKNLVNQFRQNYEVHVIDKFIDEKFFSERPEVKTLKMDLNTPALVVFLLVLAFVFFHGMGMAGLTPSYFRTRGAVLAPEEYATDSTSSNGVSPAALINLNKQKEKCVFCDSIFPAGTYTTCPNCGGSLVSIESSPKGNGNPAASSNPYTGASVGPGRQPTFWEK